MAKKAKPTNQEEPEEIVEGEEGAQDEKPAAKPKKTTVQTYEQEVRQIVAFRNNYLSKKPSQARMVAAFDCLLWKAGILDSVDLAREPLPIEIEKVHFPAQPVAKEKEPAKGMQLVLKANELFTSYKTDLTNFILVVVGTDREALFKGNAFDEAMKRLSESEIEIKLNPAEYQEAQLPSLVAMAMAIEGMLADEPAQSLHAFDLIPLVEKDQTLADAYAQKEWTIEQLFLEGAEILMNGGNGGRTLAFTSEEVDRVLVDLILNHNPSKYKPSKRLTMNKPNAQAGQNPQQKPAEKPQTPPVELTEEERNEAKRKALEALQAEEQAKIKKRHERQEAQKKKRAEEAEKKRRESGQMSLFDFGLMGGDDDE